ncbi:MAG: hypothetical protein WBD07_14185 [Vicinamibacterales bacterium]
MHITMVKKRLADGTECRKCQEATALLQSRGLWEQVTDIVWAHEDDPTSRGMVLGRHHGVDRAPFFIVRDDKGEAIYVSVLQLVKDRFDARVTAAQQAESIDVDEVGGI